MQVCVYYVWMCMKYFSCRRVVYMIEILRRVRGTITYFILCYLHSDIILLFMPYILSTLLVLTSLLVDAAFMPAGVDKLDEDLSS